MLGLRNERSVPQYSVLCEDIACGRGLHELHYVRVVVSRVGSVERDQRREREHKAFRLLVMLFMYSRTDGRTLT